MRRLGPLSSQEPNPKLLGFSQAGAILGLSPYATALDVWMGLVRGVKQPNSLRLKRGKALQALVQDEALDRLHEDRTKWTPEIAYADERRPWLRCSIDAEREDRGRIIEVKTHSSFDAYGPEWTDEIPDHELVQVVGYLAASEAAEAIHAVFAQDRVMLFRVLPHPELAGLVLEAMERFWVDHVETGKPPIETARDARSIARVYQGAELLPSRAATPEERDELGRYARLLEARKHLEAEIDATEARLAAAIGDAKGLHVGAHGSLSWSPVRGFTSWKGVALDLVGGDESKLAELAERHRGEGTRRFYPRFRPGLTALPATRHAQSSSGPVEAQRRETEEP